MLKDYTIIVKKSGEQYVSLCLENMVVGRGMTKDEAIENVRNAIESYVNSLEEGMSLERPVPLKLLHEFLIGEEEEIGVTEEASALKVLTYG